MPVSIGKKPDSDFSDPPGMLSDCHRRIERFLNLLITLAEQARGGSLNSEQREGLDTPLRYFRTSVPRHTYDEELSPFPRMRKRHSKRLKGAISKLDSLQRDHVEANESHRIVDAVGRRWLSEGRLPDETARRLTASRVELRRIYAVYIACEAREFFRLRPRFWMTRISAKSAAKWPGAEDLSAEPFVLCGEIR